MGSRPSGRSSTSRSTVRAASSDPASASASSRPWGTSTTSHSGRTPRETASTGSNARARSSHATMEPAACASAATRSASVVRPELGPPRSATVADRGRPPVPSTASSAVKPVETTRPSSSAGTPGRVAGANGLAGVAIAGAGLASASSASASSSAGSGAIARAPWTTGAASPQRRGAAAPHRVCMAARTWETSDARVIGRPIIERMFYSSRVSLGRIRRDAAASRNRHQRARHEHGTGDRRPSLARLAGNQPSGASSGGASESSSGTRLYEK